MKVILKSPTVSRLWGVYKHRFWAFFWATTLFTFIVFAMVQSSDQPKKYIYAQGTYHKSSMFRCDFGVIRGWGETEFFDIKGNVIPCKVVRMKPSEFYKILRDVNVDL